MMKFQMLCAILCMVAAPSLAATLPATPANLTAQLATAQPGDTVQLADVDYPPLTIKGRIFAPPLVITGGRFTAIVVSGSTGITFRGVTVAAPVSTGYGVNFVLSKAMRFEAGKVTGAGRGIVIDRVDGFAVIGSQLSGLRSDGIDIGLSRNGLVDGNTMFGFSPTPAVYAAGKLVTDGDHPDGIQLWSRPTDPPTSDVVITNNVLIGPIQCVFAGNHSRPYNGVMTDDGGFDRLTVKGNVCRNSVPNGISIGSARNSLVTGNDVRSLALSTLLATGNRIKTQLNLTGAGSIGCGNIVPDVPKSPTALACK